MEWDKELEDLSLVPSGRLSEVVLESLAWSGPSARPGWQTWLHGGWTHGAAPDGWSAVQARSEVTEGPVWLGRTESPSLKTVRLITAPNVVEILCVLTPAYLSRWTGRTQPVLTPATDRWPHDPPSNVVPPVSARTPMLVGTGCNREGKVSMLGRPLVGTMAEALDLVPHQMTLGDAAVDLLGYGGILSLAPAEMPIPWLRLAMTGRSGIEDKHVVAGPELVLLSRWLQELSTSGWEDRLGRIEEYEAYQDWGQVSLDQQGPRRLGDLVPASVARDTNLLATVLLSDTIAPPRALGQLGGGRRVGQALSALERHPRFARWLGNDRPQTAAQPWS